MPDTIGRRSGDLVVARFDSGAVHGANICRLTTLKGNKTAQRTTGEPNAYTTANGYRRIGESAHASGGSEVTEPMRDGIRWGFGLAGALTEQKAIRDLDCVIGFV